MVLILHVKKKFLQWILKEFNDIFSRTRGVWLLMKYNRGCLEATSERSNIPLTSARTWTLFQHPLSMHLNYNYKF